MMLHNFFKHYAQRENFVRPISCVVLTSNDGRKGANFNILIDIYFLPFYFLFFPFFNFILYLFFLLSLVVKRAGRIDCKGNRDVINYRQCIQHLDCCRCCYLFVSYLICFAGSSCRRLLVYQQQQHHRLLYPMVCVNKD